MRRETRQLSLAEALVGGGKGGARLERIAGALDWKEQGNRLKLIHWGG